MFLGMDAVKAALACFLGLSLVACGEPEKVPANQVVQLEHNLELSISHSGEPTQGKSLPSPTKFEPLSIESASSLIAYKQGEAPVQLKSTQDLEPWLERGYKLEPEQRVLGLGSFEQGHIPLMRYPLLWEQSKGDGVVVALIDSGVQTDLSVLKDAILPGYDFITHNSHQIDESGHGTAIASLIAARGPEYFGMAPEAKILPLRVLDKYNTGSSFAVSQAILFAADLLEGQPNPYKADIINLSLGMPFYSASMHDAIKRAKAAGVNVVAAAGNSAAAVEHPAALEEVIAVGAAEVLQGDWPLALYSSYGLGLDVLAPVSSWTRTNNDDYKESGLLSFGLNGPQRMHGTSFATAHVTGLLALLVPLNKENRDLSALIRNSVTDINKPSWDERSGYGVLNPSASMRALIEPAATSQEEVIVQILDAGSLQELTTFRGGLEQDLWLEPGRYVLRVWLDADKNGVWTPEEAIYRTDDSVSTSSQTVLTKKIVLRYLP